MEPVPNPRHKICFFIVGLGSDSRNLFRNSLMKILLFAEIPEDLGQKYLCDNRHKEWQSITNLVKWPHLAFWKQNEEKKGHKLEAICNQEEPEGKCMKHHHAGVHWLFIVPFAEELSDFVHTSHQDDTRYYLRRPRHKYENRENILILVVIICIGESVFVPWNEKDW